MDYKRFNTFVSAVLVIINGSKGGRGMGER